MLQKNKPLNGANLECYRNERGLTEVPGVRFQVSEWKDWRAFLTTGMRACLEHGQDGRATNPGVTHTEAVTSDE
jgi:hypothetical protein